jgi:hypothetical protein
MIVRDVIKSLVILFLALTHREEHQCDNTNVSAKMRLGQRQD